MTPIIIAIIVLLLTVLAEAIHAFRILSAWRFIFGPGGLGNDRMVTAVVIVTGLLRSLAIGGLVWGLCVLWVLAPRAVGVSAAIDPAAPARSMRHIVILLDVSPSMGLRDAGDVRIARSGRAAEVVMNALAQVDLNHTRLSVVAFYTTSKPIVIDTFDPNIISNIVNGLPLTLAFEDGETNLIAGLAGAFELTNRWAMNGTTPNTSVLVVTDGDSVPLGKMVKPPASIDRIVIAGVGDDQQGTFIDRHMSRQESRDLRTIATRLNGVYFNANRANLPSDLFADFAKPVPATALAAPLGLREAALAACAAAASVLLLLPIGLALLDRLHLRAPLTGVA